MSGKNNRNLFWASYADLMTALFVVMLTLFVVYYNRFIQINASDLALERQVERLKADSVRNRAEIKRLFDSLNLFSEQNRALRSEADSIKVKLNESMRLERLETAMSIFDKSEYFVKDECKRNVIHPDYQPTFEFNSAIIPENSRDDLLKVGRELLGIIQQIESENEGVEYMIVIEGSAGRYEDEADNKKWSKGAAKKSYERAFALFDLWRKKYREFEEMEVMINGSGLFGKCRVSDSGGGNRRFVIQVVPKLTNL